MPYQFPFFVEQPEPRDQDNVRMFIQPFCCQGRERIINVTTRERTLTCIIIIYGMLDASNITSSLFQKKVCINGFAIDIIPKSNNKIPKQT